MTRPILFRWPAHKFSTNDAGFVNALLAVYTGDRLRICREKNLHVNQPVRKIARRSRAAAKISPEHSPHERRLLAQANGSVPAELAAQQKNRQPQSHRGASLQ